jgi:hypothetical protein
MPVKSYSSAPSPGGATDSDLRPVPMVIRRRFSWRWHDPACASSMSHSSPPASNAWQTSRALSSENGKSTCVKISQTGAQRRQLVHLSCDLKGAGTRVGIERKAVRSEAEGRNPGIWGLGRSGRNRPDYLFECWSVAGTVASSAPMNWGQAAKRRAPRSTAGPRFRPAVLRWTRCWPGAGWPKQVTNACSLTSSSEMPKA